jgi:hypothetical protein
LVNLLAHRADVGDAVFFGAVLLVSGTGTHGMTLLSLGPRARLAARWGLDNRAEPELFAEFFGDAVGFGDVFGEVAAMLPGNRFAHAADVGDTGFIWLRAAHGDSP